MTSTGQGQNRLVQGQAVGRRRRKVTQGHRRWGPRDLTVGKIKTESQVYEEED